MLKSITQYNGVLNGTFEANLSLRADYSIMDNLRGACAVSYLSSRNLFNEQMPTTYQVELTIVLCLGLFNPFNGIMTFGTVVNAK